MSKMETRKKSPLKPGYTDAFYKFTVDRLKCMLQASPPESVVSDDYDDDQPFCERAMSTRHFPRYTRKSRRPSFPVYSVRSKLSPASSVSSINTSQKKSKRTEIYNTLENSDLVNYVQKQDAYIDQLEQETRFCREELASLMNNMKELVTENTNLHEQQKNDLLQSILELVDSQRLQEFQNAESPTTEGISTESRNILRDSRITELEAQLAEANRKLKNALDDAEIIGRATFREKCKPAEKEFNLVECELHKTIIDDLKREKSVLMESVAQQELKIKMLEKKGTEDREKVRMSVGVADESHYMKQQSEKEILRLQEDVLKQQQKMKDMVREHARKANDEKQHMERKFYQQIELLNAEVSAAHESLAQARMDLEKYKRMETDFKRELQQKTTALDDIRQESQLKTGHLNNELSQAIKQKSAAEQEAVNLTLEMERIERDHKQEAARAQSEITALRKRLDQIEHKYVERGEECIHLTDVLSQMERDLNMANMHIEKAERTHNDDIVNLTKKAENQDKEVAEIMKILEAKHGSHINELESMVQTQNSLLEKVRRESQMLAEKLEDNSNRYRNDTIEAPRNWLLKHGSSSNSFRKEKAMMKSRTDSLIADLQFKEEQCSDIDRKYKEYAKEQREMNSKLAEYEADAKSSAEKIFKLMQNQNKMHQENQSLQQELRMLKTQNTLMNSLPSALQTSSAQQATTAPLPLGYK